MDNRFSRSTFVLASLLLVSMATPAIAANQKLPAESAAANSSLLRFIKKWEGTSAKKGEFESTAEYENRLVSDGFAGQRFIVYIPLQEKDGQQYSKSYAYDADKKELTVWFAGHGNISKNAVSDFVLNYNEPITPQYPKYYLSHQEKVVERYAAMNGFGARTVVTSMRREDISFAFVNYPLGQSVRPPFRRSIPVSPNVAKEIAESGYWRLTIEATLLPSQRKYIAEDFQQLDATIQYPTKLVISSRVLMVKVISAELINSGTDEVVLSIQQDAPVKIEPKNEGCSSPYSLMASSKLCN